MAKLNSVTYQVKPKDGLKNKIKPKPDSIA